MCETRRSTLRDLQATDPLIDELTALIDDALGDPSRAALVKSRIRERLLASAPQTRPAAPDIAGEDDSEDLWNNVPL
jgi:hypothetical protein